MKSEKIEVLAATGHVELLQHGNNDLTVVNAARESFAKHKDIFDEADVKLINYLATHTHWTPFGHVCYVRRATAFTHNTLKWFLRTQKNNFTRVMLEHKTLECEYLEQGSLYAFMQNHIRPYDQSADQSANALLRAENKIRSAKNLSAAMTFEDDLLNAFEFPKLEAAVGLNAVQLAQVTTVTFRFKMPIFVERQWSTHKQDLLVGRPEQITRNEMSGRYVTLPNEFYTPYQWRLAAENVKQGSSDKTVEHLHTTHGDGGAVWKESIHNVVVRSNHDSYSLYETLLNNGIAPEMARMVLPANVYTEFWETGTLSAWARVVRLRCDPHAQKEVREYAEAVSAHLSNLWGGLWTEILEDSVK